MTFEEHKKRHEELHKSLDELIADWITATHNLPSKSTVLDLMEWSHGQTTNPTKQCHNMVETFKFPMMSYPSYWLKGEKI